jgi:hypothetical protein
LGVVAAQPETGPSRSAVVAMVGAVVMRPDLWWTALGALRRLAPPGWWRVRPHLPLPDPHLWGFRMVTAYGDPAATPRDADVIAYLEWCRSTAAPRRGPRRRR